MSARDIYIAAAAASAAVMLVWWDGYSRAARLHEARAANLARVQAEGSRDLAERARKAGDALSTRLFATQSALRAAKEKRDDALNQLADSRRRCLGAGAVGVLNAALPDPAPPRPGAPAPEGAAPVAADPGQLAASERDIARWASGAIKHYADCAAQLNTLIDYEELQ